MNLLSAVILAVIQGLTEFLPVSSSGHLVLGQKLLGFSSPPILFDVMLHMGTLAAVLLYFYKRFIKLKIKLIILIIIGSVPAGIVGVFLNNFIEEIFNSLILVGVCLLATGLFLLSTKLIKKNGIDFSSLNWKKALVIGFAQAVAILPGISRSGSTIVAGRWQGLKREAAFLFSFYLAVPAMLGALILQLPDIADNLQEFKLGMVGLVVSFVTGIMSLWLLEKTVLRGKLYYFGFYCLGLGLLVLIGESFFF